MKKATPILEIVIQSRIGNAELAHYPQLRGPWGFQNDPIRSASAQELLQCPRSMECNMSTIGSSCLVEGDREVIAFLASCIQRGPAGTVPGQRGQP